MSLSKEIYYKTLHTFQPRVPVNPSDISKDFIEDSSEWYHLLGNELDFITLSALTGLKWYSVCRCHLKDEDGATSHEHFHALVHFINQIKLQSVKRQWRRNGVKMHPKTTFKPIFCLDHAVGVLRYLSCGDGQKAGRRGCDGLMTHPHQHYSRCVYNTQWLHGRGSQCGSVRNDISELCASSIDWMELGFKSSEELHLFDTCRCDRGLIGRTRKEESTKKRREFYLTEEGKAVKKSYREKAETKKKLIMTLKTMKGNTKADLMLKSILDLVNML